MKFIIILIVLSFIHAEVDSLKGSLDNDGETLWYNCKEFNIEGFKELYFLSDEGMCADDWEGTVDGLHPNDLGMMRMSEVLIRELKPLLDRKEGVRGQK